MLTILLPSNLRRSSCVQKISQSNFCMQEDYLRKKKSKKVIVGLRSLSVAPKLSRPRCNCKGASLSSTGVAFSKHKRYICSVYLKGKMY